MIGRHKVRSSNGRAGTLNGRDNNRPYKNLAYAIVLKACEDYEETLRRERIGLRIPVDLKDARRYIFSEEPEYLTGIPGKELARRIKIKVEAAYVHR